MLRLILEFVWVLLLGKHILLAVAIEFRLHLTDAILRQVLIALSQLALRLRVRALDTTTIQKRVRIVALIEE